jgi:hypothetical protein
MIAGFERSEAEQSRKNNAQDFHRAAEDRKRKRVYFSAESWRKSVTCTLYIECRVVGAREEKNSYPYPCHSSAEIDTLFSERLPNEILAAFDDVDIRSAMLLNTGVHMCTLRICD